MTKETLEKVREFLIFGIKDREDIDIVERTEIMLNADKYFNPDNYEENNKVLNKHYENKKKRGI